MQLSLLRMGSLAAVIAAALSIPAAAQAQGGAMFRVSITNITKGQIISPVIVATHTENAAPFWTLGSPASEELAMIAEDAVLDPMMTKLSGLAEVLDVKTITGVNGPILPGETASVDIEFTGPYRWVSAAAMLVQTNDAFTGLNGVRGPNVGAGVFMTPAYDAGSEANTELCEHVPGPPCGNVGVRMTEGAEGFVYIHPGITGIGAANTEGDPEENPRLSQEGYDWRNPVAKFVIERL